MEGKSMAKKLVAYFTASGGGVTRRAANWKPGRMLNGRLDAAELKAWAEEQ